MHGKLYSQNQCLFCLFLIAKFVTYKTKSVEFLQLDFPRFVLRKNNVFTLAYGYLSVCSCILPL